MGKIYRAYLPEQDFLLPPSLRDWLPEDHLAYFVSDVGQMVTQAINTPHEVKLATSTLVQMIVPEAPQNLIGDNAACERFAARQTVFLSSTVGDIVAGVSDLVFVVERVAKAATGRDHAVFLWV
jgi:hypothetical protein